MSKGKFEIESHEKEICVLIAQMFSKYRIQAFGISSIVSECYVFSSDLRIGAAVKIIELNKVIIIYFKSL